MGSRLLDPNFRVARLFGNDLVEEVTASGRVR